MGNVLARISASKIVKGAVVATLSAAAVLLVAPVSNASYEPSFNYGCRGYWYSTSGHGYCNGATNYPSYGYFTNYDCNLELDEQHYDKLSRDYVGKYDTYECTFKINKTHVSPSV